MREIKWKNAPVDCYSNSRKAKLAKLVLLLEMHNKGIISTETICELMGLKQEKCER